MTTQIKKAFVELVNLLEANKGKKVSTIMPQILELASAKVASTTFHKVDDEVVAIYCYYHKQWELIANIPYGLKASTASGYNTMCKEGTSQWTKQQRQAKQRKEALLDDVASGKLDAKMLGGELEAIEEQRKLTISSQEAMDYRADSLEELL